MKNINQLKVMLTLVLGLSGIGYGSESHNESSSDRSNVEVAPENLVEAEDTEVKQIYLFGDAGSDRIICLDNEGNFVAGAIPLGAVFRCFVLPTFLFNKLADENGGNSSITEYGDRHVQNRIIQQMEEQKSLLSDSQQSGSDLVLIKENKDSETENRHFFVDVVGGVNYPCEPEQFSTIYSIEVSPKLFKKMMRAVFGEPSNEDESVRSNGNESVAHSVYRVNNTSNGNFSLWERIRNFSFREGMEIGLWAGTYCCSAISFAISIPGVSSSGAALLGGTGMAIGCCVAASGLLFLSGWKMVQLSNAYLERQISRDLLFYFQ
jgi:hypothetical protein